MNSHNIPFNMHEYIEYNKCFDRSMDVKQLSALLGNYDRPTDRPTDRVIEKFNVNN